MIEAVAMEERMKGVPPFRKKHSWKIVRMYQMTKYRISSTDGKIIKMYEITKYGKK